MRARIVIGQVAGGRASRRGRWAAIAVVAGLTALGLGAGPSPSTVPIDAAPGESSSATPVSVPATLGSVVPASRLAHNLAIITIRGEIDAITARSFERRLDRAVSGGADGIVVDLDTPGGAIGAVLEICSMIKRTTVQNTIAWINPTAYSGGAIIALACKEIIVAPGATMGDAAPIAVSPLTGLQELPETERQKLLSPLIAELVDSARRNGYDEMLVQAFVSLGVELWQIRDKQTGNKLFITADEYRQIFESDPPRGRPHISPGAGAARSGGTKSTTKATPSAPSIDPQAFKPASDTMTPGLVDEVDQSLEIPSQRPIFSPGQADRYELIQYATDGKTLLVLKEQDLKDYGLANPGVTIRTDADLEQFVGATNTRRLDRTWSETLVRFMTMGGSGMIVRGLLVVVFLMGMFIELSVPGVGLAGLVALIALSGLVVPPMLVGAAAWWTLAATAGGIVLIAVEIFVVPGFGVPGIAGIMSLFAGLVGTFAGAGELFPGSGTGEGSDLAWAVSVVVLAVFVAGVGMFFFARYTHKFPIMGKLVLTAPVAPESGGGLLAAMAPSPDAGLVSVGAVGVTRTPLRPSGTAEFSQTLVDVVAEYGFIEAGRPVRAVSVTRFRVGVERAPDDAVEGTTNAEHNG